jgi:hypothetical protein
MNYKTTLIMLVVLLIYRTTTSAQIPVSLQGSAVSETGEKIEFYTLILQSLVDSSVVAVEMFSDTVFRFSGIKPQTYILRVHDIQYQAYDTLITVVEGANVLKTPLVLKSKTLGEVVIKGSRPVLTYTRGNLTVDVANSYLKDAVSLKNIFGKLPGLTVDNEGKISMFGKRNLLIYINGMQSRSDDEYKSLQPGDIDKIEIIRNVGSEYDANVDAVIKIKTRKRRTEKFHVSISDALETAYYLYNNPSVSLYLGGNEKISQYITFGNNLGKYRDHHKSYIFTYFDDYTHSNSRDDYNVNKYEWYGLFYSVNCSTGKDSELGVQYSGRFSGFSGQVNGTRIYDDETTQQTVNLYSEEEIKINSSTINLNYKQKVNNTGELSVIADYMIKDYNGPIGVKESSGDRTANNIIDNDNKGRVFSITPKYQTNWKKITYGAGLKYSYLNNESSSGFRSSPDLQQTSEHTAGAYMTFGADLSSVKLKSGVRAEYTSSDILYDDELNSLHKNYFNLVPNISLGIEPNGRLSLAAYYHRRLQRPGISALSSIMRYRDSLTYLTGNPRLSPEITDVFGFNAVFYKFDFSLEYHIYRDEITFENIPDSENPNRTISTYINLKEKYSDLNLNLSYSFNHPVFTNMTSVSYVKQCNLSMSFEDEIIIFNKPTYHFQTSGDVKIFKNTSLDYSFRYRSAGHSGTTRYNKPASNFSLTVSQYMMNRNLLISFSVEDIFNKNKRNRWTQYHNGNIIYTQDSDALDSRYAIFYIRYNWGIQKSIQRKRSDTDHINRL